ncbi:50S ribosomal protein L5 [Candidatus Woesearchaeota archaeon]|nr:50S ribosomal protein L5 [Candidatus Woesearchaeota archaeon]
MNPMQKVRIEKLTLNIGSGKDQSRLERGLLIMKRLTNRDAIKTVSNKRIPGWGVRPGLAIGCKCTLRKDDAVALLDTLLQAKDKVLTQGQFDDNGNISFGIHEYIDIPGQEYDPKIGAMGLQVCVTLEKPGARIKKRKLYKKKLPVQQRVSKDEAMQFMKEQYKVSIQ